jgi:hypothetical protein
MGMRLRWCLRWHLGARSTACSRLGYFSITNDALHDSMLLCDERILAIKIAKQTTFAFSLDPALKLDAGLGPYVSHALVILALDGRPFFRCSRSSERSILRRLDIVDEGKIELGFDVIFECIHPWFWTECGNGLWQILMGACGNGQRRFWGWVK